MKKNLILFINLSSLLISFIIAFIVFKLCNYSILYVEDYLFNFFNKFLLEVFVPFVSAFCFGYVFVFFAQEKFIINLISKILLGFNTLLFIIFSIGILTVSYNGIESELKKSLFGFLGVVLGGFSVYIDYIKNENNN